MPDEGRRTHRSSLRSSHRSSTTRSSIDLESLRLSLTSDVDPALYHPASTWNPISSIQSSGFFGFSAQELEADDHDSQSSNDDNDGDLFLQAAAAVFDKDERIISRCPEDPPENVEPCDVLVMWQKTDESSTTQEMSSSDPPSSCDNDCNESDVEPCEEHYRIPPAKDEADHQHCKQDPPLEISTHIDKSKQDLAHRINAQLALIHDPPSSPKYNGYKHHFITVKEKHRFVLLYNFLKRNLHSKIILYFSTAKSTQYHGRLLKQLQFQVRYVHNRQPKAKFLDEYLAFSKQKSGVLCLPDYQGELSAPPTVEYIVQYEPPRDPSEYIFRIGRISSCPQQHTSNKALLFLTPHQFSFLQYFKAAHVKYCEYEMHNLSNVQRYYEKLVRRDELLNRLGREAYHAYLLEYASHEYRDVYDVHTIDKDDVARSFGFGRAPVVRNDGTSSGGGSKREDNRWKPCKKEGGDWMNREDRSWRHANRHTQLVKKERIR